MNFVQKLGVDFPNFFGKFDIYLFACSTNDNNFKLNTGMT
jgi:hypothetical protein